MGYEKQSSWQVSILFCPLPHASRLGYLNASAARCNEEAFHYSQAPISVDTLRFIAPLTPKGKLNQSYLSECEIQQPKHDQYSLIFVPIPALEKPASILLVAFVLSALVVMLSQLQC